MARLEAFDLLVLGRPELARADRPCRRDERQDDRPCEDPANTRGHCLPFQAVLSNAMTPSASAKERFSERPRRRQRLG